MTRRSPRIRGCTYAVSVDADATHSEVAALATYLSTLSAADCEVLIVDEAEAHRFESNRRVLRWVGRHVPAAGSDLLRTAVELASCEKVIIAGAETRCSAADIESICALLDKHEVVEPQEYVAPDSWWGGVEAGGILLHRGLEQPGQVRSTLAIRRSAYRPLLEFEERSGDAYVRRLISQGAEHFGAQHVFLRREAPNPERWVTRRVREAAADFSMPMKTAFFVVLIPLLLLMAAIGGAETAGGYAGLISFASVLLAVKGRAGAARFFPMYACLFAPLWVAERAVSVYGALALQMRGRTSVPPETVSAPGNSKAASR